MNKKLLVMGFACLFALSIAGCGTEEAPADSAQEAEELATQVVSYDGASIETPGTWQVADADDGKYVYPEYGGLVYLSVAEVGQVQTSVDEAYADYVMGLTGTGPFTVSDAGENISIGEAVAYRCEMTAQVDDMDLTGELETIFSGTKLFSVMFAIPDDAYDDHAEDIEAVLGSIRLDSPEAPTVASAQDAGEDEGETALKPESQPEPEPEPEPEPATTSSKYEYAFVRRGPEYDLYYLIDLDEMTATYFGTNDSGLMVMPCSGDLDNGLTIDFVDEDFQERLQYKVPGDDSVAILTDGSGFEWEYARADVAEAESVLASVS